MAARVGKMPTASVRRRISRLSRSAGLLDQIWVHTSLGNSVKARMSPRAASRWSWTSGSSAVDVVQEPVELGVHRGTVGLVVDRVQHRLDRRPHRFRGHAHEVRGVVGAAALPGGSGQVRCDRFDQALVGVTGDQTDTGQAAGDEVGEELVPRRPGLTRGHAHAEDLAVSVAVDAGGQQDHRVDHSAALSDLHGERVSSDEGERARSIEGAVAELLDVLIQLGGHPGDLRLRQGVDSQGLDQLVHPPGADAGEIAVGHHRDQRGLRALAALQEPLGEVGALPQLRDRHVDGADPGVQRAAAVAVALRRAARRGLPVLGAHDGVGIRGQQGCRRSPNVGPVLLFGS